jgi:hypothetical protein
VLEVVTPEPGATPVLVVAGPHQEVERLGPIVRANEAILISALTPYRDGDPLEDPRTVRLTMPEDEPDGLALHVRPRDGGTPLVWVEPATGRRLPN